MREDGRVAEASARRGCICIVESCGRGDATNYEQETKYMWDVENGIYEPSLENKTILKRLGIDFNHKAMESRTIMFF